MITQQAQDLDVDCDADPSALSNWLNNQGNAAATDDCGTVNWSNNFNGLSSCGTANGITVTFTADDGCGNSASTSAILSVVDNSPPVLDNVAQNQTVECDANAQDALQDWLNNNAGAIATDNCGVVLWDNDYDPANFVADCGETGSITVEFTARDVCGNSLTTTATFTIVDTQDPFFISFPPDITVECGSSMLTMGDEPTAEDACDTDVNVVFKGETRVDGNCTGNYQLIRNWMAIDDCGRSATSVQTITVQDTEAPLLTGVPDDATLDCAASIPPPAMVTAWDICEGDLTPSFSQTSTTLNLSCPTVERITRTWSVVDDCGNPTSAQQIITLIDEEAPVFTCPNDVNSCTSIVNFPTPSVTDNCAALADLMVTQTEGPNSGSTFPEGTTQVCFEATDQACHTATCCFNVAVELLSTNCCLANPGTVNFTYNCPGDDIMATTEDNNGNATHLVDPDYGLLYILVADDGVIVDFNMTGIFEEPAMGNYFLYTYSALTNGDASSLTNDISVNMPIDQLISSSEEECIQVSAVGVPVSIHNPLVVSRNENIFEGDNGGVTPFFYNEHIIEVEGGTGPYTYQWERNGYVRHRITTDTNNPTMNAQINIIYADQATWEVTITDANGCTVESWKFTNDPLAIGGTAEILDVYQTNVVASASTAIDDGELSIWIEGGCPPYSYTFGGPLGFSTTGTAMNGEEVKLTDLHYGWYTVSITDAGGSASCPDATPQTTLEWLWVPYNRTTSGFGFIRGKTAEVVPVNLSIAPNPFIAATSISFNVPTSGLTKLVLFSIDGKQITTLLNQDIDQQQGYQLPFNKEQLAAGVYILQLTTADQKVSQQKMMITK